MVQKRSNAGLDVSMNRERLSAPRKLLKYIEELKNTHAEIFWKLPFDDSGIAKIGKLADQYRAKGFENVVVIGIGGSSLGTLAVWKALRGACPEPGRGDKKLFFAETLDVRRLSRLLKKLRSPSVFVVVSKSGTTTETIANTAVLLDQMKNKDQAAVVTDRDSKLWHWAQKRGFDILESPRQVGGRYSVFSAVGLFPLALGGVDISRLVAGAKQITSDCLLASTEANPALRSALTIWKHWKRGKIIHDTFLFEPDLEWFGKWYRQLTGESTGKGGKGLMPTVSIGTTDLHSVAQLYLGGPDNRFTTFVSVRDHGADFVISNKSGIEELVPDISGKAFSAILDAILAGAKTAYQKKKLPFMEIKLAALSPESVGALLQMKMIEMAYLANLLGVNAFDNPQVEMYKEETRKALHAINTKS